MGKRRESSPSRRAGTAPRPAAEMGSGLDIRPAPALAGPELGLPASLRASLRVSRLRRALRRWFGHQRRDYPWRRSRDPYAIWVSEIMLQQTRIAAVLPVYERFLEALPTLSSLASAPSERVLSLWSGLGYYSRARALHGAAKQLVEAGGATFPRDYAAARQLPGVGPYTAAAVLSIAYAQPYAAVDGNVVRILARLECLDLVQPSDRRAVELAACLLDPLAPGDWNQALMELGQSICLPRKPLCSSCPWRGLCRAYERGVVESYPRPRPRRERERVKTDLSIVRDDTGRLLVERGAFPFLRHLWLPLFGRIAGSRPRGTLRHAILHRDFHVRVLARTVSRATLEELRREGSGERRIVLADEIPQLGRSSLLSKALEVAQAEPRRRARQEREGR